MFQSALLARVRMSGIRSMGCGFSAGITRLGSLRATTRLAALAIRLRGYATGRAD
ncbi:MAG: hypothetical protein LBJ76_04800 [Candidatus Accumulibacter sp.]|nr:hypothetical protein [Accumulibacter sp.]